MDNRKYVNKNQTMSIIEKQIEVTQNTIQQTDAYFINQKTILMKKIYWIKKK